MNKLEKILSGWNFKKIAVWYLILAVVAGLICAGTVGFLYRERIEFAVQYSRIKDAKTETELKKAVDKAAESSDAVDVLIFGEGGRVSYSAKNSEFKSGISTLHGISGAEKYLQTPEYPNAVFRYVKSDEFMLTAVLNKDFDEIRSDYDDYIAFQSELSDKTVYVLNRVKTRGADVCIIAVPTSVRGGETALKASALVAMLFFCVYWVLVALWMYKDSAARKLSTFYWGIIGLFTNLVGLVVYKIYKRSAEVCPECGALQSPDSRFCSFCGARLGACCESCGGKVSPRDNFCRRCGKKIK